MAGFQLAVPAYVNPGDPEFTNLLASSPLPGIVIMDNNNGSSAMTGSWLTTADSFRAAGILTLAYVYSSNGTTLRTLGAVEADINNALVTGDSILHFDGIFVDEMLSTAGTGNANLTFYENVYNYIVTTAAGISSSRTMTVAMNAGTAIDDRFPTNLPGVIFCTFEDTEAHYFNSSYWVGGNVFNNGTGNYRLGTDFPQNQFMHLVYAASNSATMQTDVATAFTRNAGWVYVTNDTVPNPWDTTPAWGFSLEAAAAAAQVTQAPGTEEEFTNDGLGTVSSGGTTGYPTLVSGASETWTVNVSQAFPAATAGRTQFHVCDTATGLVLEKIAVTGGSTGQVTNGQMWTVTRGAENTTPLAHTSGFQIKQVATAGVLSNFAAEDTLAIRLKDYGAIGDGATDNTNAFIAWAAAINAAPNGARAFVDWGNFGTTNPVPVITNSGVVITGAGFTQTARTGSGGSTISALAGYAGGPLMTLAGEGIQCEQFNVNGNGISTCNTLVAVQAINCQFEFFGARAPKPGSPVAPTWPGSSGTSVTNATGQAVTVSVTGGTGLTVAVQYPGAGSALTMATAAGVPVIVPNTAIITVSWSGTAPTGWTWAGLGVIIDVQNGGTAAWAHNCRLSGINYPSIGVMVNDTDGIYTGCKPVSVTHGFVLLQGASGTLIEGNHITPGASGATCVYYHGNAGNILIAGNRFDNYTQSAIQLSPPTATPSHVAITGNDFYSAVQPDNTYALIGMDTTLAGIRNLKITGNTGGAGASNRPSCGVSAQTLTGGAASNSSRVASLGCTVTGNSWLTVNGLFGNSAGASQAFGNFLSGNGTTWGPYTAAFTSFATGGAANLLNSTAGNSTTMVAGTWYYAALMIPYNVTLTGIAVTGGTASPGSDKWIVALWAAAGGTALANSATAGTTAPAVSTKKQFAFTSTVNVDGPGAYIIGLQSNGTTAQFLSFGNAGEGFITGSVAGTFGTIPSLAPASTYTANTGPFASTY